MNAVTQVFVVITGLVHLFAWLMESILWKRPAVQRMFLADADSSPGVRLWAFNQGFYNLFMAIGAIGGVVAYHAGHQAEGRAVSLFVCASMLAAGVVLWVSDRRLWRGAVGQGFAPLIALVAAALS
jgi:putative membrane protein